MNLPFFIARRYLFGKKSKTVINYISAISVVVIAVVTMALFVILSLFNGLEALILSMYDTFDPDIKIIPTSGKIFIPGENFDRIKYMKGVISYAEVLEEDVLLKHRDKQFIGRIKGVSSTFNGVSDINANIIYGENKLSDTVINYLMMGQGIAYSLSVGMQLTEPVHFYAPRRTDKKMASPENSYSHSLAYPAAVFETQQDIDSKYVLSSMRFARSLLHFKREISAVELKISKDNAEKTQKNIAKLLGPTFKVKNRLEQHDFVNRVMKSEKWGIFLIVSFIMLIASFNVVGAVTMLIVDKKKDIIILKSMGASELLVKQIFLFEGWLISLLGAVIGLISGLILCWLQIHYGIIKLNSSGSFVIDSYPVHIKSLDILWVFLVVSIIGFIAAYIPVRANFKTKQFKTNL